MGSTPSSDPWTSVSKVHSEITEFPGNIFSGTFELLLNSHMQTWLNVVEWLQVGRSRSALQSPPRQQVLCGRCRWFRGRGDCARGTWYPRRPQTGRASHPDIHRLHRAPGSCPQAHGSPEPARANTQFSR